MNGDSACAHVYVHEHVVRVQGQRVHVHVASMRMCVSLTPFVLSPHCVCSNITSRVREVGVRVSRARVQENLVGFGIDFRF